MATETTVPPKPPESPSSREIAGQRGNFADLLTALDSGIRITGLVLSVDAPKEFKGTSKGGNAYAFVVRELQIWTGNKAVLCKDQRNMGETFPPVEIGVKNSFKIKSVRMNGTVPIFELDTAA